MIKLNIAFQFSEVEAMIISDKKFLFTMLSFAAILLIFTNLNTVNLPLVGAIASIIYFLVNGAFLAYTFFEKEKPFLRLALGTLSLIALLGVVSWLVMIIHNLDIIRSTIALCIAAALCSLMKHMKAKHAKLEPHPKQPTRSLGSTRTRLYVVRILYLFMAALLFYMLYTSRAGEVHTVWEVMHPAFIPMFFATTLLLLGIIFSSEHTSYKLLFIIVHSILSHSFYVIIFPVGDVGGQQLTLAGTRLVFDNIILHGLTPGPMKNVFLQIYQWSRGINFQTALNVIFARMFGVDVYWSHLLLVPLLWGVFIPVAAYMTTKALGGNKNFSVLSSLLVSSFPFNFYWGAVSIPNSIGYIFFFYSLFFLLKYLSSDRSDTTFLMVAFSLISFLSHFLTGIISFSLLLLAMTLKKYEEDKDTSPISTRISLLVSFIFSVSLLPLSLVYHGVFHHIHSYFGLDKLYGLPTGEIMGLFLIGEYVHFSIGKALIFGVGTLAGLVCMIYLLKGTKRSSDQKFRMCALFLSMGFLMVLIDYRILKLFMVNLPLKEERLWLFRDFIAVPFVAIATISVLTFLSKKKLNILSKLKLPFSRRLSTHVNVKSTAVYILAFILVSGSITASLYYGYPHWAPLQTTPYEMEAARYIHKSTSERYIVVCDQWMIYAGGAIVGIPNPRAYYFLSGDPRGVTLFLEMKKNPTNETMTKAMKTNNSTIAYFIIEKPRLSAEEYNRIIQQARENGLPTYKTFDYEGEEKLTIFYHRKPSGND